MTAHSARRAIPQRDVAGHEPDTVNVWRVVGGVVGLTAILALALVVSAAVMSWSLGTTGQRANSPTRRALTSSPGVRAHQAHERAELHELEHGRLHSYRWHDPERTHARIPIERAMELMAARDIPVEWRPVVTAPKPEGR